MEPIRKKQLPLSTPPLPLSLDKVSEASPLKRLLLLPGEKFQEDSPPNGEKKRRRKACKTEESKKKRKTQEEEETTGSSKRLKRKRRVAIRNVRSSQPTTETEDSSEGFIEILSTEETILESVDAPDESQNGIVWSESTAGLLVTESPSKTKKDIKAAVNLLHSGCGKETNQKMSPQNEASPKSFPASPTGDNTAQYSLLSFWLHGDDKHPAKQKGNGLSQTSPCGDTPIPKRSLLDILSQVSHQVKSNPVDSISTTPEPPLSDTSSISMTRSTCSSTVLSTTQPKSTTPAINRPVVPSTNPPTNPSNPSTTPSAVPLMISTVSSTTLTVHSTNPRTNPPIAQSSTSSSGIHSITNPTTAPSIVPSNPSRIVSTSFSKGETSKSLSNFPSKGQPIVRPPQTKSRQTPTPTRRPVPMQTTKPTPMQASRPTPMPMPKPTLKPTQKPPLMPTPKPTMPRSTPIPAPRPTIMPTSKPTPMSRPTPSSASRSTSMTTARLTPMSPSKSLKIAPSSTPLVRSKTTIPSSASNPKPVQANSSFSSKPPTPSHPPGSLQDEVDSIMDLFANDESLFHEFEKDLVSDQPVPKTSSPANPPKIDQSKQQTLQPKVFPQRPSQRPSQRPYQAKQPPQSTQHPPQRPLQNPHSFQKIPTPSPQTSTKTPLQQPQPRNMQPKFGQNVVRSQKTTNFPIQQAPRQTEKPNIAPPVSQQNRIVLSSHLSRSHRSRSESHLSVPPLKSNDNKISSQKIQTQKGPLKQNQPSQTTNVKGEAICQTVPQSDANPQNRPQDKQYPPRPGQCQRSQSLPLLPLTQSGSSQATGRQSLGSFEERPKPKFRRFSITRVLSSPVAHETKLLLLSEEEQCQVSAILRDEWNEMDVPCCEGDFVNIVNFEPGIGRPNLLPEYIIDHSSPYLFVLHPDVLVSPSNVSQRVQCGRRAVLEERLRFNLISGSSEEEKMDTYRVLLRGSMLHDLFQTSLKNLSFKEADFSGLLDEVMKNHIPELWSVGLLEKKIRPEMQKKVRLFVSWAQKHLHQTIFGVDPPTKQAGNGRSTIRRMNSLNDPTHITKIVDIEESVWSPMFGLKGRIDVTVEAETPLGDSVILPLEFKSGKSRDVHRAQLALYTFMLSDRYQRHIDRGFLFALGDSEMETLFVAKKDANNLLIARNYVAFFLAQEASGVFPKKLPPMIGNYGFNCRYCKDKSACVLYHHTLENGNGETSGFGELFSPMVEHLTETHLNYLVKWDHLIDLEKSEVGKRNSSPLRLPPEERERNGMALCNLRLVSGRDFDSAFVYCFQIERSEGNLTGNEGFQFCVGDLVALSSMSGSLHLAKGSLLSIQSDAVEIRLNQSLRSPPGYSSPEECLWVIDKDELSSGFDRARENLFHLFLQGGDSKRRELIVDLRPPSFKDHRTPLSSQNPSSKDQTPSYESQVSQPPSAENLNSDQSEAIQRILEAEDYVCILGMPGTGKTTTISHIVDRLVRLGNHVLVSSYTHSAVDNVLRKLAAMGRRDILRLGQRNRIAEDIQRFSIESSGYQTVDEFDALIAARKIFGVTCLGTNHPLFRRVHFDYCIVDEASQITQPVCFGPIRSANIFVLVGDDYQLPPLVQSAEAIERGMEVSLFKRLCDAHPQALVYLASQYRMNEDIMLLANTLVYKNRLKCGTEEVAQSCLEIPHEDLLPSPLISGASDWIREVLLPSRRVVFLDTDQLPAFEEKKGVTITNPIESKLTHLVIGGMVQCGIPAKKIGVIAPYRAQLQLMQPWARSYPGLEISTVDRYQGRDKECIVICFCCSNEGREVGKLLRDQRRCNVAFTRAKKKLILIGSVETLTSSPTFEVLFEILKPKGWLYPLPPDAHRMFPVPTPPPSSPSKGNEGKNEKKTSTKEKKNHLTENIISEMLPSSFEK